MKINILYLLKVDDITQTPAINLAISCFIFTCAIVLIVYAVVFSVKMLRRKTPPLIKT